MSWSNTQGPRMSRGPSASWPITAIFCWPASGSRPSFFSSTNVFPAASRATSRCAASASTTGAAASSTYGFSNRPSRNFASSTRSTAASSSASLTRPAATASGSRPKAGSNMHISMSRPACRARAPASVRSAAKCWTASERTALASLTTQPVNPNCSRSTSVSSQRLPLAGTPLRSM